jgi:sialate O-acetylesterase
MFLLSTSASAKLRLPALIGDHMVLQQDRSAAVWGWAEKGQAVTVSLAGKSTSGVADAKGAWKLSLRPLPAGGPYEMTINSGEESLVVHDVLVGEVWLGSGQSNMEFLMSHTHDASTQVPQANYPNIRLFTVPRSASPTPKDDVVGSWQVCTPETVQNFSAVAYHFGKEIHKALKTPVGLIASDWGGTPVEDWIPPQTLEQDPANASLAKAARDPKSSEAWFQGTKFDLWVSDIRLIPKDKNQKVVTVVVKPSSSSAEKPVMGGTWTATFNPGSKTAFAAEGNSHSGSGPAGHFSGRVTGGGWGNCSTSFSSDGKPVDLRDYEAIEFYIKGNGAHFEMLLSQPSIADSDNYGSDFFEPTSEWQLIRVPLDKLKQGGWGILKPFTPDQILTMVFLVQVPYCPEVLSVAYNGMIAPLTPYPIRGVLWYQGETNTARPSEYHQLLSALITGWRQSWGEGDFPFLIVQLPNFMAVKPEPSESTWAELREAQLQTLALPHTGLATTIDLGEADNIHPRNKTDVGKRLALCALGVAYDKRKVTTGPLFDSLTEKNGKVTVQFQQVGKGLKVKGKTLKGFALAGADQQFHWAKAKVVGKSVEVWSDEVKEPVEVRYAWADNPVCNLYNRDGLPASPFRAKVNAR